MRVWSQGLALEAGHVLFLGAGSLILACASFMVDTKGLAAKVLRIMACGMVGLIVLAAP